MPLPSPRNKILPVRGNLASLQANLASILEGEICYAFDLDQYYQKEGGVLVAVGASQAQGALADSAVQPGDNITTLTNNAGYITDAGVTQIIAGTNVTIDPAGGTGAVTINASGGGGSGITNLAYTASPTDGTVTSDTGTDATLTLADGTNAGLMSPGGFTVLNSQYKHHTYSTVTTSATTITTDYAPAANERGILHVDVYQQSSTSLASGLYLYSNRTATGFDITPILAQANLGAFSLFGSNVRTSSSVNSNRQWRFIFIPTYIGA